MNRMIDRLVCRGIPVPLDKEKHGCPKQPAVGADERALPTTVCEPTAVPRLLLPKCSSSTTSALLTTINIFGHFQALISAVGRGPSCRESCLCRH